MIIINEIKNAIVNGEAEKVKEHVKNALNEEIPVSIILNEGFISGMAIIGSKFKNEEVYIPDVMIAARAMQTGMEVIKPLIARSGIKEKGTMVIGTVKGDLHDIGKNLVLMMMEGAGYKVIDLGIDVSPEKFLLAAQENNARIVGLSALLTTTMIGMKETIDKIKEWNPKVKVMVGGAPVSQKFADDIGADGFALDVGTAIERANELMKHE